ncbi:MAG: HAD-IIB family hydrolase [Gammaproteobacteria bacterium]|nr:HAD-IIB family hydrolase [Gammaproteobacteria bacterium]
MAQTPEGMYILLISIHGLIRGADLELGRDADTGGQILYVVELARALAANPSVARVDLLTRRVDDPKVSSDYAKLLEPLCDKANIVRLPCGPRRYLRKEVLWPYLDCFADHALAHVRTVGRCPSIVHAHYADAGYAGARIAGPLGVPLIFTGHSLGRVKRERLLARGAKESSIESQYNFTRRIDAEEMALDAAALVIASTHQEVGEQYQLYDNYQPRRMVVIPPGVNLERFHPPRRNQQDPPIAAELNRFLSEPHKPLILAVSRADERKNIATLVRAYAEHPQLRDKANLAIVAGNRDDINALDKGPREVLSELLMHVDRYDLYGHAAYPKHHQIDDVPDLYRHAARTRGVFVNPALTEPFGLTLIEAAASGLPIIATNDGGPCDIVAVCRNGQLVDPLDAAHMGEVIYVALSNRRQWRRWSKNGVRGAHHHFSWQGHAQRYLAQVGKLIARQRMRGVTLPKSRMPTADRLLISDIDNTLIGDAEGLHELLVRLQAAGSRVGFGIATGRRIDSAVKILREWGVPSPDVMITAVGGEIYYGPRRVEDLGWRQHIDYRWKPDALRSIMCGVPGVHLQPKSEQRVHKISYYYDPEVAPDVREIVRLLRVHDLHANVIFSHQEFLDVLPIRASKGLALRYLALKWGLPPERFLVAGDSGNDEEMLTGNTLAVVVGNHSPELEHLRGQPRIHFAAGEYAWGIIEGTERYGFLGTLRIPEETSA